MVDVLYVEDAGEGIKLNYQTQRGLRSYFKNGEREYFSRDVPKGI